MSTPAGNAVIRAATEQALHVAVAMTCFNRRNTTLACLDRLYAAQTPGVRISVHLVDDGSKDGTALAVRERFPDVEVVAAEGDLYWCRGMHRAMEHAIAQAPDFLLWLNDDTLLEPDALERLLACHDALHKQRGRPPVVVGGTRDSQVGRLTYGGERRVSRWRPLRFAKVEPQAHPVRVDTFDGNIVLLSRSIVAQVGNLDPVFEHAMGDIDYGLRASNMGIELWLAPRWMGVCDTNSVAGTFLDRALSVRRRLTLMMGRKGLPPRSWWHFNRKHSGMLWPLAFVWPYLRMLLQRGRV